MKNLGSERRKNPRLKVNFVISYRIKKDLNNSDLSQSKNVSSGGMLLTTNRKFDKGTYLDLTLRFPFLPAKTKIIAEVIESKEVVKNIIYETHLKFFGLAELIQQELSKFVTNRIDAGNNE